MLTPRGLFWFRWLFVVTVGLTLFSLSFVVVPDLVFRFFGWMFSSVIDLDTTLNPQGVHYVKFTYGVLGAVMTGWSVSLLAILLTLFRSGARSGWWALMASITVWFVVDTSFSLIMGFVPNAVFNILFFVLFMIPLAATYSEFHIRKVSLG